MPVGKAKCLIVCDEIFWNMTCFIVCLILLVFFKQEVYIIYIYYMCAQKIGIVHKEQGVVRPKILLETFGNLGFSFHLVSWNLGKTEFWHEDRWLYISHSFILEHKY